MSGVSVRILAVLLDTAAAQGLPVEALTRGLGVGPREELSLLGRIEWDTFATVCDRLGDHFGNPDALTQFGEKLGPAKPLKILRLIGRVIYDPRDLVTLGGKWLGPTVLPMLEAEIVERPDGVFVQRLQLQDGHRQSPSFFYMLKGLLAAAPIQWGSPPFQVEMDLDPRGATLYIRPSLANLGWLARGLRWVSARFAVRSLLSEIEGQRTDIHASYREVRNARDRIAVQAKELEQVNSIGRELSRHIELDQVAQVLTRVLLEDLAFAGAELELNLPKPLETGDEPGTPLAMDRTVPTPNGPPIVRVAGDTPGDPFRRYPLETAAGPIGTLAVWLPQGAQTGESAAPDLLHPTRESVLERMLPWISIALDNARTYRQLESHAADLQSRILERTAKLLATNHHLVREIEERKQATDALLVSEAQLRSSERLASIGTLAAGIAHEINNPVGSILAAAQLALIVQPDDDSEEQVIDSLTDIVAEAKRCGEIVRSVLQFSRDERTEKWDCRLQDVVVRAARITDPYTAEFRAQVRSVIPEEPIWVHVNPIQIEQALVNLIRNAIEADGRDIQVIVESIESEGIATIEVRDNGSGISDQDQVRVFEPFYTTKRSDGGTGLGLSVVHGIVKEHGGTLKASPNSAGGACVLIELGVVAPPEKSPTPETKPPRTGPEGPPDVDRLVPVEPYAPEDAEKA